MLEVYIEMLPLILGAMLLPLWIIIVLMLLSSESGLAKGAAFVGGVTTMRLVQGVIFGTMLSGDADSATDTGPGATVFTLLLVLGILLLISAYKKWASEPDPDEPSPQLFHSLTTLSVLKTFGLGALLVSIGAKLWVFTLGAIGTIAAADLSRGSSIVAYLLYVISAQLLIILPVVAYAVAPESAGKTLGAARMWLEKNSRVIMIVVSLVFGLLFLWKGVAGLLG